MIIFPVSLQAKFCRKYATTYITFKKFERKHCGLSAHTSTTNFCLCVLRYITTLQCHRQSQVHGVVLGPAKSKRPELYNMLNTSKIKFRKVAFKNYLTDKVYSHVQMVDREVGIVEYERCCVRKIVSTDCW